VNLVVSVALACATIAVASHGRFVLAMLLLVAAVAELLYGGTERA
jgi:hypothetical protein